MKASQLTRLDVGKTVRFQLPKLNYTGRLLGVSAWGHNATCIYVEGFYTGILLPHHTEVEVKSD